MISGYSTVRARYISIAIGRISRARATEPNEPKAESEPGGWKRVRLFLCCAPRTRTGRQAALSRSRRCTESRPCAAGSTRCTPRSILLHSSRCRQPSVLAGRPRPLSTAASATDDAGGDAIQAVHVRHLGRCADHWLPQRCGGLHV